jgi:hypothetical protein
MNRNSKTFIRNNSAEIGRNDIFTGFRCEDRYFFESFVLSQNTFSYDVGILSVVFYIPGKVSGKLYCRVNKILPLMG